MKVVDLHPDELLDKESRGELNELERARLDAHLARCATCRFEREVRADFAEELEDTSEISSSRLVAFIEGAALSEVADRDGRLDESAPEPVVPVPSPDNGELSAREARADRDEEGREEVPLTRSNRPARVRHRARLLLLVAAALFLGTAATATAGIGVWEKLVGTFASAEAEHGGSPKTMPTLPENATPTKALTPVVPVQEPPEPVASASLIRDEPPPAPTPIVPAVFVPSETPKTLFEAASEARRQGDYARSITLHRRLQAGYPTSREAHASQATVGRLLLDRGEPAAALESFDAYQVRGSGAFDEPVLVGRATALERLGRTDEARRAWQSLLTAFPDTPYRSHAEARLLEAERSARSP